ncbi:Inactive glycoside hydrolase XLP1 [Phytophthora ramorum]|uniref:Inactive glycoside hydrolase XLP1 n=1 Tax=Phytophthora ramorum TaxID=164328 RepID=UPI0030B2663C|nr:Inactive glycoside hydrolase XLP1 [Phytophthora ramorum]
MKFLVPATLALAAVASTASAQEYCGRDDNKVVGPYTVYNNLWAEDNDPKGKQCTELAGQVVRQRRAQVHPKQVSAITSIPTSIKYAYTYDGKIIANVAYDLFTSSSEGGSVEYELMVWLSALGGAWPLTETGKPIKSLKLGGVDFDLYQGMNKNVKVFSYVAKKTATSFTGDLKQFFDQLPSDNTIPATQFLQKVEAGTEPFQGTNAKLVVTNYSVQVK